MAENANIIYDENIITNEEIIEDAIDISKVPVIKLENCEVFLSSLTSKTPQYGHSVELLLPDDTFYKQDKFFRQKYTEERQKKGFDEVENYKTCVKPISKKLILDKPYYEKIEGRKILKIVMTNAKMYDDETGEKIKALKDSSNGKAKVRYFRIIDKYTGKGIEPKIFRYINGEKTFTFTSKKTKKETPYYIGKGDTVNVEIRPYETEYQGTYYLKYNLLSVEIVQSAFDKGERKGNTEFKKRVVEKADTVDISSLSNIFGSIETKLEKEPVKEKSSKKEVEVKIESEKVDIEQEESAPVQIANFDFSSLTNMSVSAENLGE